VIAIADRSYGDSISQECHMGQPKPWGMASTLLPSPCEFGLDTQGGDMRHDMAEDEYTRGTSPSGEEIEKGRVLTYDETKAAEAAFRGDPFNPSWSAAAAEVYAGISAAMAKRNFPALSPVTTENQPEYVRC
jgi:hypothetical protein